LSRGNTSKAAGEPPAPPNSRGSAKYWIASAVCAAVISFLSTDTFSSENTSRLIVPALRWLFPHASVDTLHILHAVVRKAAHLTEYFLLSTLLFLAQRGNERGWKLRWAILAVVMCAGYASLDEFHQSFVPSRTASPWDSVIDTTGASVAQCAIWIWRRGRNAVTGD
jgi:VanZ family protein